MALVTSVFGSARSFRSAVAADGASARTDHTALAPLRSLMKYTRLFTAQQGARFVAVPSVSFRRLLPSMLIVQMSCCPGRWDDLNSVGCITLVNTICFPSGLQLGLTIAALVVAAISVTFHASPSMTSNVHRPNVREPRCRDR